jgi:hypothetical protein
MREFTPFVACPFGGRFSTSAVSSARSDPHRLAPLKVIAVAFKRKVKAVKSQVIGVLLCCSNNMLIVDEFLLSEICTQSSVEIDSCIPSHKRS